MAAADEGVSVPTELSEAMSVAAEYCDDMSCVAASADTSPSCLALGMSCCESVAAAIPGVPTVSCCCVCVFTDRAASDEAGAAMRVATDDSDCSVFKDGGGGAATIKFDMVVAT
jgi:hypothetical protein